MELVDGVPHSYLGDGLYAKFDGFGIWLLANSHNELECTDKVYLEPQVLSSLNTFYKDVKAYYADVLAKKKEVC